MRPVPVSVKPFKREIHVTRPLLPDLESVQEKLREIWDSQWLTNNGYQHQLLECKLMETLKVAHLSLFNNGTIALITACQALRLSGEVITTPFTFPATPHVLTWNNVKPIFCDIDPVKLTLDPNCIEDLLSPQTTGILGVHVFGNACDVDAIQEIANRHGLRVVYDAAHAFNTEIDGRGIGNFGDVSMFSFHATKLFHTLEGGALTFNDPYLKPRIDLLKNFGIKSEDEIVMPGINGKMNEVQAAIGLVNLELIEQERAKRARIVEVYRSRLADIDGIRIVGSDRGDSGIRQSYQYFVIRINEREFGCSRDFVYRRLKEYNVFARKYFFPLCSDYTCYRNLPSAASANLPVANQVAQEVLSLPLYGGLELAAVERICDMLRSFSQA
jgi:dTDP-4-amino-4,6-dideoxygalactose transaminase